MRKHEKIILMVIMIAVVAVFANIVVQNNLISGDWAFITTHLIGSFMWLIFSGAGFVFLFNRIRTTMISSIGLCSLMGFNFAGLIKYLYDNGIWMDSVITATNTIEDYMIIVILAWVVTGVIIGAYRK